MSLESWDLALEEVDPLIPAYLEAEHVTRYDPGRHEGISDEVHASGVAKCQRRALWKYQNPPAPEASPYFTLGDAHEDLYGGPLRERYGDKRVRQDVGCTLFLPAPSAPEGVLKIVGESDWTVFSVDAPGRGHVCLLPDGTRTAKSSYDEATEGYPTLEEAQSWSEYDDCIDLVVETKTTKDLESLDKFNKRGFKPKHRYQLAVYMRAFNAEGRLTYMTRNEWNERNYRVERSEGVWSEAMSRAYTHYYNRGDDVIPAADPLHDQGTCERFCSFVDECKKVGGQQWGEE